MFVIFSPTMMPMCLKMTKNNIYLLHYKYGRLNFKGLNTLAKKDTVKGLPTAEEFNDMLISCDWKIKQECHP